MLDPNNIRTALSSLDVVFIQLLFAPGQLNCGQRKGHQMQKRVLGKCSISSENN